MSNRYKGGVISATPPTTSASAAPGIWTLEQQMQAIAGSGWPFGGPFTYIEDVFSTWLYKGTSATQTITNGIDLSTQGGMVWMKNRTTAYNNAIVDSARGLTNGNILYTNLTSAAQTGFPENTAGISAFNTTGFTLRSDANGVGTNYATNDNIVSWTFREQPKFFDIVTYTGDGTAGRTVAHNLGSAPGCILVKKTSGTDAWAVYHRGVNSGTGNGLLVLNTTAAQNTNGRFWWGDNTNFIAPTSTNFTVSNDGQVNASGATYVAYLFAHNAGGFGLTGSDNVISCGSFTTDGAGDGSVTLGYEPQWMLVKESSGTGSWSLLDNMRGLPAGSFTDALLSANLTTAEADTNVAKINATGASFTNYNPSATVIYIAIRRGPMKVPTLGTTVFSPALGSGTAPGYVSGFPVDLGIERNKGSAANTEAGTRLTGAKVLQTNSTAAEANSTNTKFDYMNGFFAGTKGTNEIAWMFRRAPGYFDVVCYTGNNTAGRQINHNLSVPGELIIIKSRSSGGTSWRVWVSSINKIMMLELTNAAFTSTSFIRSSDSTTFTVGGDGDVNGSSAVTYVAYLFATCAGVSKVGSYTGTATTKQIDCGFTAGARFVLIKRTDSTGDWYVYDSARGIVSGNDPYLLLNSTAAEVTNTDYVDTYNAGFELSSTAPAGLNANGGTYIFLAIA
jgi:hypothetical protein